MGLRDIVIALENGAKGALLVAISVLLALETLVQIGVVISGKVAVGLVGPPTLGLDLGLIGRGRGSGRMSVSV
jgi:hypothetical protein